MPRRIANLTLIEPVAFDLPRRADEPDGWRKLPSAFAFVCGERDAAAAEGGVDLRRPAMVLQAIFWLGWGMALLSSFLISHFELAGISQVFAGLRNCGLRPPVFTAPFLYRRVRHQPHFSFLLAWATPVMTIGHLLFAGATTAYIRIATQPEERDLIDFLRRPVPALLQGGGNAHPTAKVAQAGSSGLRNRA